MPLRDATGTRPVRGAPGLGLAPCLLLLLSLSLPACIVPVRSGPAVSGRVVDAVSGEPLAGAVVVARWDGRYGDALPDREQLGHAETVTGPDGRFELSSATFGGVSVWPFYRTEVRIVGVMRDGYRCPAPRAAGGAPVILRLTPGTSVSERRDSCRPIRAVRDQASRYMTAWRQLFPSPETPEEREQRQQLERLLAARRALGFGANCEGPAHDLALAPDGTRVAWIRDGEAGREARVLDLLSPGARPQTHAVRDAPPRRLAWTGPLELVLWQPSGAERSAVSSSIFAATPPEIVWRADLALPAALDRSADAAAGTSGRRPIDPGDVSDEAETRWQGRSFSLERTLDPATGLARDRLRVRHPDGQRVVVELPGEACGGARFGRPHYRIDASGRTGVDLRFVEGGCRPVRIDLHQGTWTRLDEGATDAVCRVRRRLPPDQLETALRGWTLELRQALEGAGADPEGAYSLLLSDAPGGAQGRTRVLARSFAGEPLTLDGAPFPVATPLERIDVSHVAPTSRTAPGARGELHELEPL